MLSFFGGFLLNRRLPRLGVRLCATRGGWGASVDMVFEASNMCLCLLCVFLMSGVWGQKVVTYGILSLFLVLLVLGFNRAFLSIFEMDVIIGAISLRE